MYHRILVALDDGETAARGLLQAVALAQALHAQLRLIAVVDIASHDRSDESLDAGRHLLAQGEVVARAAGVAVENVLRETDGDVADVIAAEATTWPADLIVLGTHGRRGSGIRHLLLGSVAEGVARRATVPVLLVRAVPSGSTAPGSGSSEPESPDPDDGVG